MDEALLVASRPSSQLRKRSICCAALITIGLTSIGLLATSSHQFHTVPFASMVLASCRPSSHPRVEWVEARAGGWNAAADAIIHKLRAAGVKRGQIISIDAHNNGPTEQAIFSAHFVRDWPSNGHLAIRYKHQNTDQYGWGTFYSKAAQEAGADVTDVISITGSSNGKGRAVEYVFFYEPEATSVIQNGIKSLEMRASSWNAAANGIIEKLQNEGVRRGQIIGIDAHNNGNGAHDDAIFNAYYDKNLPGYGQSKISYEAQNTKYGWSKFYSTAATQSTTSVISITSASNVGGRAVTYVFNYDE